jgi:hypothetical protein
MNEQTEKPRDVWQAEIDEKVHNLSFDELAALISSGMLLRQDKVRRGDLRWLEAGRVPALDAYFAYADARETPAGPVTEEPKETWVLDDVSEAAPVAARVSTPSHVKSFACVLLLSLVFTYLWMYYRDAADRAQRNALAGRADVQSVRDLELEYGVEKKFLTDQLTSADHEIAQLPAGPVSQLSPAVDTSMCYRFIYKPIEQHETYPFGRRPPETEKVLDTECVSYQREMAQKRVQNEEKYRNRRKESLLNKRTEVSGQLEDLESETDMERRRLTESFYMAAGKSRFYYGFIPIFLVLVTLNTGRIILRKKIAPPLRGLNSC